MKIEYLRTPDERFSLLPAFPYEPHYIEHLRDFHNLRMAYIDEGDSSSDNVFLCLHGEPTWGYLYRKMLPVFTNAGCRVVVPDLFGFGRSDKPTDKDIYTFDFHRQSLMRFIEHLDLRNITLVCQDWGGLLGLTIPMDMPNRFTRLIAMNTTIATGESISEGFAKWKKFAAKAPEIPVSGLIAADALSAVNLMDALAYDAPFPDNRYKAGVIQFPQLVPVKKTMAGADLGLRAREFWSQSWMGQSFLAIGMRDQVLGEATMKELKQTIRNSPEPIELADAGHFVQEYGDAVAEQALRCFGIHT